MANPLTNRTEILFLYEIENANPNGDPLNENRPRYDSEENRVLVSDVRLKRTVRDYWYEYKGYNGTNGKDIFVRETTYQDGDKTYIVDGKRRAKAFQEKRETVLEQCIDVRTFGGVLPLDKDSITLVGPTQFQMGKSLNKTEIVTEQGTGAFASGDKKGQATFRTEYKIPYALIGFNGIINEKAAAYSQMTVADKELLLQGIWEGTKNLISRSKFGQTPLLLLTVDYNEPFYIGGLRQRLKLTSSKNEMQLRSTDDYILDVSELIAELIRNKSKIAAVHVRIDPRLKTTTSLNNGPLIL
ncbi:type I-B CRISPR-associated protein Cas7/Csh2 [Siphonobacter sp. SORGH_AS_1065]|uniref:type I-B CRISPR-associated protein Cas7/Csh2 n=1 Tax=Siphonobacter sp. SORGH_AS_1065 TaxID=3041795 RepID=UPI002783C61E|nr:type I-B CRISPR-associated protein Cas7/Csh2 [Siphonobacter sp. SORGH_AS_1065]MDQ1086161.1 CRISPR-associated protein Csh2 [Siphonobacter sp. SORGH_AS_1065]